MNRAGTGIGLALFFYYALLLGNSTQMGRGDGTTLRDGFNAALQSLIEGENGPATLTGDGAQQDIYSAALDAIAAAQVEQASRFFMIGGGQRFVWERSQDAAQLFVLDRLFDAGENFLADWAQDGCTTVADRLGESRDHLLLFTAEGGRGLAAQDERPDAGVD